MAELKTFLFTDICGSVRLKGEMIGRSVTERDLAFISQVLTPHRARIERGLTDLGGRVVSTAGDGHFLVFDNTVQAAQWAIGVQESHRDDPIKTPKGDLVEVRISMHVGVPQVDPHDPANFVGKTVDYAARLNDYATGAQILVSRSVMAILDDVGLEGIRLHSHGKKGLKGIGNVEVYELLYDNSGPRTLRNSPKSDHERQWTVLPTVGFDPGQGGVAVSPALRRAGNYELEELLGSGGMGDVYKARHVQFGRVRAVKVIKPQFVTSGHSEMVRRFYNEIKAVGRLEHKNIVVAIDSSSPTDKVHYLVMEYIDGVGADDLVAQYGHLPIPEACEIIRQAARGLQFIHKNDMVHRDLKPSNLMVTVVDAEQQAPDSTLTQAAEGERAVVKILDLGLALLAEDGEDRLTRYDHKAMGTGMYMSPEQWKTTSVDIRADIYSLGCTLYHLLSGNPPFSDSDLRPEKAHEKSAVPPIRSVQPIPKKLWDVVKKMLEKRPEDRYATPAEVSAALMPFCEGHQLAKLVRGYQFDAAPSTVSQSRTVADASARADTWRSRSKAGSTLREAFGAWNAWGVRALVGLAAFAGVMWLFYAQKQERMTEGLKQARSNLSAFAQLSANERGALSEDLTKRFAKLIELSHDPTMIDDLARNDREALAAWIGDARNSTEIPAVSWFITNDVGVQVARAPSSDASIGESYRHRDYFHGKGPELSQSEAATATPVRAPHLSSAYPSDTDKNLKVALSVPIWSPPPSVGRSAGNEDDVGGPEPDSTADDSSGAKSPPPAERKVVGVFAMSVNVADFNVLDQDFPDDKQLVLVDLRKTLIGDEPMEGIILQHPELRRGQLEVVDQKVYDAMTAADPLSSGFRSAEYFLENYRDPLDESRSYWGAFQPVTIKLPADASTTGAGESEIKSDWVLLVQQPRLE